MFDRSSELSSAGEGKAEGHRGWWAKEMVRRVESCGPRMRDAKEGSFGTGAWPGTALTRYRTSSPPGFRSLSEVERVTPVAKVGYRWRQRVMFEVEAGVEQKQTAGSTQQEDTTRQFYSLGYRWDF